MPGAKAGRSSGEGPQEPRFVEGPEITHYWLKVKNPAYERKEPVEFRTTAKKFQELSFDVGRAYAPASKKLGIAANRGARGGSQHSG